MGFTSTGSTMDRVMEMGLAGLLFVGWRREGLVGGLGQFCQCAAGRPLCGGQFSDYQCGLISGHEVDAFESLASSQSGHYHEVG